jgi:hypothetical protein
METMPFAKQTLGFQKTILENSFNAMNMIQDHTEKMFNGYLDQQPWMTPESKKSVQTSIDIAKKARDDFKNAVDEGFSKFEELLEVK